MKFLKVTLILLYLFFPLFAFADSLFVEKSDVKLFIQSMVDKHHFNKKKLTALFASVKVRPQVIEILKHPPEKETWKMYQGIFLDDSRIQEGAAFRKKYHQTLVKAEKKYGVPGSIIIATLGVETQFGTSPGDYRIVDSLSSLAFNDLPRAAYFRSELEQFLLLTRENHLDPLTVQGSYAGAIGLPQFMPSSYRNYAVSFTKKNHIDLIRSIPDAIASIANYYKKHGWKKPHLIAVAATVHGDHYLKLRKLDHTPIIFSSSDLDKFGIVPQHKIPKGYKLKLIEMDGQHGKEYWLAFSDFDVIKRYNYSDLYAMAVFQLGQHILSIKK